MFQSKENYEALFNSVNKADELVASLLNKSKADELVASLLNKSKGISEKTLFSEITNNFKSELISNEESSQSIPTVKLRDFLK
ncbi:hypothetical protein [Priestia megaterium]|uniref:hypothetical protein n=1 Tax=Priestia megaterium TaxID=1404 RepID=UPI00203DA116|nr:hypothetical protein [Priestia megaterium]MCM3308584.1 hypothetical protein [Priestia megaterium]